MSSCTPNPSASSKWLKSSSCLLPSGEVHYCNCILYSPPTLKLLSVPSLSKANVKTLGNNVRNKDEEHHLSFQNVTQSPLPTMNTTLDQNIHFTICSPFQNGIVIEEFLDFSLHVLALGSYFSNNTLCSCPLRRHMIFCYHFNMSIMLKTLKSMIPTPLFVLLVCTAPLIESNGTFLPLKWVLPT